MKVYQIAKDVTSMLVPDISQPLVNEFKTTKPFRSTEVLLDVVRVHNSPGQFVPYAVSKGWDVTLAIKLDAAVKQFGGMVFTNTNKSGRVSALYVNTDDVEVLV